MTEIGKRLSPIVLQIVKNTTGDDEYDDEEEVTVVRRRRNLGDMTQKLEKSLNNMKEPLKYLNKYYEVEYPEKTGNSLKDLE